MSMRLQIGILHFGQILRRMNLPVGTAVKFIIGLNLCRGCKWRERMLDTPFISCLDIDVVYIMRVLAGRLYHNI